MFAPPSPQLTALSRYLDGHPEWVQEPGSERTNLFTPGGRMYCVPADEVGAVLRLQGECAAARAPSLLMERQQAAAANCMMLDIDGDYAGAGAAGKPSAYAERNFVLCSRAIAKSLYDVFDWEAHSADLHGREPALFAPADARGRGATALGDTQALFNSGSCALGPLYVFLLDSFALAQTLVDEEEA